MSSKMDETMEEEEMLAGRNTVCTRCPDLEKKIVFYQKKISWLRRSKRKLKTLINANSTTTSTVAITLHVAHSNALLVGFK